MMMIQEEAKENDYTIAAVDRALTLLDVLGRVGPASLALLAKEANCTRTGAFRLLRTMSSRGFVIQDGPRGIWRLGARLDALRQAAADQGALAAATSASLKALAAEIGEVVYLLDRHGTDARILAIHAAKPDLRQYFTVGALRPLAAGAGRLLLAYAPAQVQEQVLSMIMPRYTPVTITDPTRIAVDLARIRTRGWLITQSESELASVSISAPIRNAGGDVVAMITVAGPSLRLRGNRPRELLPTITRAADDISRSLGWNDRRRPAPRN